MNIRQVLRTYSLLRQLTDDESALLETLRRLNDAERESLVVALQPEKVAGKRASKKSSKSASKSARGQSISSVIQRTAKSKVDDDDSDGNGEDVLFDQRCAFEGCAWFEGDLIHDEKGGYAGYHPFVSAAPPARGKSSTNGGATNSTASSEMAKEDVSNVHHAGG